MSRRKEETYQHSAFQPKFRIQHLRTSEGDVTIRAVKVSERVIVKKGAEVKPLYARPGTAKQDFPAVNTGQRRKRNPIYRATQRAELEGNRELPQWHPFTTGSDNVVPL